MSKLTFLASLTLCLVSAASACSGSEDGVAENGGGGNVGGSDASSGGSGNMAGVGASGGTGNTGATDSGTIDPDAAFAPIPVRSLPGLESITFYERTGGSAPTPYEFTVNGPELTVRLPDPLSDQSHDIPGADSEFYDVYYSDGDGQFDIDGSYLTISGMFGHAKPAGGGLNLAEISLNFSGAQKEYGNYVASYVVLGDNSVEASVPNCIDGDLQTHTTMGNTVGATERLRLTLGFESTSGIPR